MAPSATGTPILIQESANTVVGAFVRAAALSVVLITMILAIFLRRVSDVLLTLVPLLLASVETLELMVLLGLPFNFANIIALRLPLGVGVAFKIYYVLAWRSGETSLLASPLTRAVLFSALTTAPLSEACGSRTTPARRAWVSCWVCRYSRPSPQPCCFNLS